MPDFGHSVFLPSLDFLHALVSFRVWSNSLCGLSVFGLGHCSFCSRFTVRSSSAHEFCCHHLNTNCVLAVNNFVSIYSIFPLQNVSLYSLFISPNLFCLSSRKLFYNWRSFHNLLCFCCFIIFFRFVGPGVILFSSTCTFCHALCSNWSPLP